MAAMPKNFKLIFFSRTRGPMILKLGMQHLGLEFYNVYMNDDHELTLAYFTAWSNMVVDALNGGGTVKSHLVGKSCRK